MVAKGVYQKLILIPSQDLVGKVGVTEGYGYTETGNQSKLLLENTLTIRDNAWCAEQLRANFSKHLINRRKIKNNLSDGLNEQIICARGELAKSVFTGEEGYKVSQCDITDKCTVPSIQNQ